MTLCIARKKRVVTRIKGGIGNQLFCYAAARRLALVNGAELVIDDVTGFIRDKQYRRRYGLDRFQIPCRKATPAERLEPFERYRRAVMKWLSKRRPFEKRRYVEQEGIDFDERLLRLKVKGTIYLDGLWQSEGYFKDVEKIIREDLKIIPPSDADNQRMAERISTTQAVAVHVRFFDLPDYVLNGVALNNTPACYYERAIAIMEKQLSHPHYYLFSDQPRAARTLINLPDNRVTVVAHNLGDDNAYADVWLMSLCKHFIIANSTFSWWGAWLAENPEKKIIAPGFVKYEGAVAWGFKGLLPEEWIKVWIGWKPANQPSQC